MTMPPQEKWARGTLTNPHINYSVSSSQYTTWYNRQITSVYNESNPGYLFNTIPICKRRRK